MWITHLHDTTHLFLPQDKINGVAVTRNNKTNNSSQYIMTNDKFMMNAHAATMLT